MPTLSETIAARMRAGSLVVIVKEPDERLALEAARLGGAPFGEVRVMSGGDPEALGEVEGLATGEGVLVVPDFFACVGDNPFAIRAVREVALQTREGEAAYSRLILIETPSTDIAPSLLGDVELVTTSLPDVEALKRELSSFVEGQGVKLDGNGETLERVASSATGLARHEAAMLFRRCYVERNGTMDVAWLRAEKAARVSDKLGGAISFEDTGGVDVGGQAALREWIKTRGMAFNSAKARAFGLPEPKGVLLLGTPGGGKSLQAKAIARTLELPLMRFDVGKVFGSLVGQSESQMRQAIEAAEASAPCVLWIDEIEKSVPSGSSGGDSGTSQRVLGSLLTWLQEKTSSVFVVATANKISALPPELLRKGRFDEIFFVDQPTREERAEIADIHFALRGVKLEPKRARWATKVADASNGFSGAEIAQAVIDGMFSAFAASRPLEVDDVLDAIKATSPLSVTMRVEIDALRSWAAGRARSASGSKTNPEKVSRTRGPRIVR